MALLGLLPGQEVFCGLEELLQFLLGQTGKLI